MRAVALPNFKFFSVISTLPYKSRFEPLLFVLKFETGFIKNTL